MIFRKTANPNIYSNGPENKEEQSVYKEIEINEVKTENKTTLHVNDTIDTPTRITNKQGCSRKVTILLLIICIITVVAITVPVTFIMNKEVETCEKPKEENTELIVQMKDWLKTSTILFKAKHLRSDLDFQGETLIFDNLSFNIGKGYNKTTGIFTAPVAGTYLFMLELCPEDGCYLEAKINKVTREIGRLQTQNNFGTDGPCISTDAISVLSTGDTVSVICTDILASGESDSGDSFYHESNNAFAFSGVLIHNGP